MRAIVLASIVVVVAAAASARALSLNGDGPIDDLQVIVPTQLFPVVPLWARGIGRTIQTRSSADSGAHAANATILLDAYGRTLQLELSRNDDLFHPAYASYVLRDGRPERVDAAERCHYTGTVAGDAQSSAFLSTCNGHLTGAIFTSDGHFFIEPHARINASDALPGEHAVYRRSDLSALLGSSGCGVHNAPRVNARAQDRPARAADNTTKEDLWIEILVMTDYDILIKFNNSIPEVEAYVALIMSLVRGYYASTPFDHVNIHVVLKGISVIVDANDLPLSDPSDSTTTLTEFSAIQKSLLPYTHHDHAILLGDVFMDNNATLGKSWFEGICDPLGSASVNYDFGYMVTALTITHELGHSVGADHDGDADNGTEACDRGQFIMAPSAGSLKPPAVFSNCSIAAIDALLANADRKACLLNDPTAPPPCNGLPGTCSSRDQQCRQWTGSDGACSPTQLNATTICRFVCHFPSFGCDVQAVDTPMLDGTACGADFWCMDGECVSQPQPTASPTASPTATAVPTDSQEQSDGELSAGEAAAIAIVVLLVVVALMVASFVVGRRGWGALDPRARGTGGTWQEMDESARAKAAEPSSLE